MKNKKVLSMCAALGLVAVVGVGGTLAYLSDTSRELKNTFTTSQKGVDIELWENNVKENPDFETTSGAPQYILDKEAKRIVAGEDAPGARYEGVLPGSTVEKNPTIDVLAGSEDCYLFVSIENASQDALTINYSSNLLQIPSTGNVKYYAYDKDANGRIDEADIMKAGNEAKIFESVVYSKDANSVGGQEIGNIVIKAAAVQSKNNPYDGDNGAKEQGISLLNELNQ